MTGEPGNPEGGTALVPASGVDAEIAIVEREMLDRSRSSPYWHGAGREARQAYARDLYRARDNGQPVPKIDARVAEIAKIERMIQTNRAGYFADEALQERYRQLLDGRPAGEAGDDNRATLAEVERSMPAAAAAFAGDADALGRAQDQAATIAALLGDMAYAEEASTFAGLPDPVQSALLSEMGRQSAGFTIPATADEIVMFRANVPGGDELIRAWAGSAMRRVGGYFAAGQRLDAALDAGGRAALGRWLSNAPLKTRMTFAWTIGNNA